MSSAQSPELFARLRQIIEPYADRVHVKSDDPAVYYLEVADTPKPELFSAVMMKRAGVAFHYFPVYVDPSLVHDISPELKRRMQGKSCFTFKRADDPAIAELAELVGASADAFLARSGPDR